MIPIENEFSELFCTNWRMNLKLMEEFFKKADEYLAEIKREVMLKNSF